VSLSSLAENKSIGFLDIGSLLGHPYSHQKPDNSSLRAYKSPSTQWFTSNMAQTFSASSLQAVVILKSSIIVSDSSD
jgi:hypothetical protein